MHSSDLITSRHSVRKYKDEFVSKEDIKKIMEVTKFTQSWGNKQVARFTFVSNKEIIDSIAKDGVNEFVYNVKTLANAKDIVILSFVNGQSGIIEGDEYATDKGREWEVFDAGIACQTFALAAHSYGVGTCVMGIIDSKFIADIVKLPENETVAALITMGYPAFEPKETPRLSVDELIRFVE